MIWFYIALTLGVMIYIYKKFTQLRGFPVLQAKIMTNNGLVYKVEFKKIRSETTSIEHLRLSLSFITKIYAISSGSEKNNLKSFLKEFETENNFEFVFEKFKEIVKLSQEKLSLDTTKTILATSYFKDIKTRNLTTKLPLKWYSNQLYLSVIALLMATYEHLNEHQKGIFSRSLKLLSTYYTNPNNPTSAVTAHIVANDVFVKSTFMD